MNTPKTIFSLLGAYKKLVALLVLFTLLSNGIALIIPQLISKGIDNYGTGVLNVHSLVFQFSLVVLAILIFTYLQNIIQVYASERVAKDIRQNVVSSLSKQSFDTVQTLTPSRLLTTITSDSDAVKVAIAQAIPQMIASIVLIIGAAILLLSINWKLALVVLAIIPLIGIVFGSVLKSIQPLFLLTQQIIDRLNKVINESIVGSALIRVLNTGKKEQEKFDEVNSEARNNGLTILSYFSVLIPVITFIASLASLAILMLGGKFVIAATMTLGEFTAFNTYVGILIFPIIIIGFVGSMIAQSSASYERIVQVLDTPHTEHTGTDTSTLSGAVSVQNVSLTYGEKTALKDISIDIKAGQRVAIIGPTAAGKTQLMYLLTSLTTPTSGSILYDGKSVAQYDQATLHNQVGLVFQDSVLFNTTLRENIAFSKEGDEQAFAKAVETAELNDFINTLPQGLDTIVSERGTTLSGGQKQRIMLARALTLNPKVLLLDDFTARVDTATEERILANVHKNYPHTTLISVTQKIGPVEDYDLIILLMEGELVAQGTHKELLATTPEYVQIYNSQRSTNEYELHA